MFDGKTIHETCMKLDTDRKLGLSEEEARKRLAHDGTNELQEKKKKSGIQSFIEQLCDPLIYVLLAAAAVSILLKEMSDAIIILVVVIMNGIIGMIQEGKAEKALEALKKLASPHALVVRGGKIREIHAKELVTGDLVSLDAGCQVPADLRLVESENLKIEESALTGESVPTEKRAEYISRVKEGSFQTIPLGDRMNMAYMSTVVSYGRGMGIVTDTGMQTEIGKIATMIQSEKEETTPLQKRLGELGKVLSLLSVGLCAVLFVIAILQQRDIFDMLITAISLAVAAVPEGLPAVVTICLALSVTRMVKVNTIVRRLPCVETLGAVSVVCSDKTGTLTQNVMTVEECYVDQNLISSNAMKLKEHTLFLEGMTLCNDAVLQGEEHIGDPTELALLYLAEKFGMNRQSLEKIMPRKKEIPFDSNRKMMSTFHERDHEGISFTKGAPDEVLKKCTTRYQNGQIINLSEMDTTTIQSAIQQMSQQALRTLAIAMKKGGNQPVEEHLTFLGMVGMRDPARPEAKAAVEEFKQAGVTTVMITGDHVDTAYAIANKLGIVENKQQCMTGTDIETLEERVFLKKLDQVRVFARISPEQKVKIVRGFQAKGNIVAMTGDGVNDAPSLKAADIGISMGMNGTDVAKQASDMILTDDNFATIEKAIAEGRGVYENIKKSIIFLLSSNLGEIMTMFVAVMLGLASPLKSSHILWINLITDSLPALALGVDLNDRKMMMNRPPRAAKESLFANGGAWYTGFYGALIATISLTAFFILPHAYLVQNGMEFNIRNIAIVLQNQELLVRAQTYAFTVLGMSQLFHAIGMRNVEKSVFKMNHLENKLMILAFVFGFLLQISVTEIPFLVAAFKTAQLSLVEWIRLAVLAAFPLLGHELLILFSREK